jgi:site-specific DNA-methyltransferase (adenine-specific)
MSFEIKCDDVFNVLPLCPDNSFDGCLTDPPYELNYMGQKWDSSGVAFNVSLWRDVFRVMKPGAYLLAFGAPRTHHRLMVAIEDAGFELRDVLMWCYTSGFPKAKSCLKPSWEPIVLACKRGPTMLPLNIDACRIGNETRWNKTANNVRGSGWGMRPQYAAEKQTGKTVTGRWPGNILFQENDTWDKFFFCSKPSKKEREAGCLNGNIHPTVKPLDTCKWLATLIKPAGEARLLVPFSGSGSEVIGGLQAGWNDVVGVELDPAYVGISKQRIEHWTSQPVPVNGER